MYSPFVNYDVLDIKLLDIVSRLFLFFIPSRPKISRMKSFPFCLLRAINEQKLFPYTRGLNVPNCAPCRDKLNRVSLPKIAVDIFTEVDPLPTFATISTRVDCLRDSFNIQCAQHSVHLRRFLTSSCLKTNRNTLICSFFLLF